MVTENHVIKQGKVFAEVTVIEIRFRIKQTEDGNRQVLRIREGPVFLVDIKQNAKTGGR